MQWKIIQFYLEKNKISEQEKWRWKLLIYLFLILMKIWIAVLCLLNQKHNYRLQGLKKVWNNKKNGLKFYCELGNNNYLRLLLMSAFIYLCFKSERNVPPCKQNTALQRSWIKTDRYFYENQKLHWEILRKKTWKNLF